MGIYNIIEESKYLEKFEFLVAEQQEIQCLINEALSFGCDLTRPGVEIQPKRVGTMGRHVMGKLLNKLELAVAAARLGSMEAAKAARRQEIAEMKAERLAKEAKEPPVREVFRSRPNWLMGIDGRPVYY